MAVEAKEELRLLLGVCNVLVLIDLHSGVDSWDLEIEKIKGRIKELRKRLHMEVSNHGNYVKRDGIKGQDGESIE